MSLLTSYWGQQRMSLTSYPGHVYAQDMSCPRPELLAGMLEGGMGQMMAI